jgi:hypothetical protein
MVIRDGDANDSRSTRATVRTHPRDRPVRHGVLTSRAVPLMAAEMPRSWLSARIDVCRFGAAAHEECATERERTRVGRIAGDIASAPFSSRG